MDNVHIFTKFRLFGHQTIFCTMNWIIELNQKWTIQEAQKIHP